jgi:hypothetical protein
MSQSQRIDRTRRVVRTGLVLATTLFPLPLLAQTEAPAAAAPETPAAPAEPAPAPAPGLVKASVVLPAPPQVAQAAVVAPAPAAPTEPVVTATAPSTIDEKSKPMEVNVWGRLGNEVSKKKGDGTETNTSANAEVDLLLNGRIHKYVGWTADFVATYGPGQNGTNSTASILDLIGKFEFDDAFNVWVGRMLVPSDRSNFSGAWFMSPWAYPGTFHPGAPPVGPRQGAFGRNDGATAWGQFGGGLLKYYVGAFDLTQKKADGNSESPLFTSRINLSLINPEPGYYHSSTYYGGKDILAIGLSGQYKKDGSVGAPLVAGGAPQLADYTGMSVDVLFEKNTGAGTLDLEGAFYGFKGDNEPVKNYFYGLASYLIPGEIGIGRLQPLVRYQQAKLKGDGAGTWKIMEAQVGYAIKEYAARLALGYQRFDLSDTDKTNAFVLGIQLQK